MMAVNKQTLNYIGMIIFSLPSEERQEMLRNVMSTINRTFETFHAPPPFRPQHQAHIPQPQEPLPPPSPFFMQGIAPYIQAFPQEVPMQAFPIDMVPRDPRVPNTIPRVAYDGERPIFYEVMNIPPLGAR
jgi:hypothetical protein